MEYFFQDIYSPATEDGLGPVGNLSLDQGRISQLRDMKLMAKYIDVELPLNPSARKKEHSCHV